MSGIVIIFSKATAVFDSLLGDVANGAWPGHHSTVDGGLKKDVVHINVTFYLRHESTE